MTGSGRSLAARAAEGVGDRHDHRGRAEHRFYRERKVLRDGIDLLGDELGEGRPTAHAEGVLRPSRR